MGTVASLANLTFTLPDQPERTKLAKYGADLYTYVQALIEAKEIDATEATIITTRTEEGSQLVVLVLTGSENNLRLYQRLGLGFQPFARWLNGWIFNVGGMGCVFGVFAFDPNAEWQDESEAGSDSSN